VVDAGRRVKLDGLSVNNKNKRSNNEMRIQMSIASQQNKGRSEAKARAKPTKDLAKSGKKSASRKISTLTHS